jgi:hypothetical protein
MSNLCLSTFGMALCVTELAEQQQIFLSVIAVIAINMMHLQRTTRGTCLAYDITGTDVLSQRVLIAGMDRFGWLPVVIPCTTVFPPYGYRSTR